MWGGVSHEKLEKLFIIQKKCVHILFGDQQEYNDKFCICARTRYFAKQFLAQDFYTKERSKSIFNWKKLLTVHNLYSYYTAFKILKILRLRTPTSIFLNFLTSILHLLLLLHQQIILDTNLHFCGIL